MKKYLYDQNLHWQEKKYESGVQRELLSEIKLVLDTDQIIAISGVRRCGKSFLLKQIINYLTETGVQSQNILFLNLEFPTYASENSNEILSQVFELYFRIQNPEGKLYIFLDEIQTINEWEKWLKYQYDQRKGKIKFFITGSNSQFLSSEFASRLSGRVIEKVLFPFSFSEVLDFHKISHSNMQEIYTQKEKILHYFDQYLEYGGMPELLPIELIETKRELLLSYFNTIIYKDVIPRFSIRSDKTVYRLALYLLSNSASLMNIKKMSEYLQIKKREQTRLFLDYLQQSYLNFILTKFDFSHKIQLLSQKKIYSIDTGFVNLLPLRFSANKGKLLENVVFLELKKRFDDVYYFRNDSGESDFIVHNQLKQIGAYQVCYELDESNRSREFKGLALGCKKINIKKGYIITFDQEDILQEKDIEIEMIPFWKWALSE